MSVVSDSVRPHRQQPTRLLCPWDSPGKNTGVGCHFLLQCIKVKSESEVGLSCPTPRDPMDCSLSGSSVHGISQAEVLERSAIAFSCMWSMSHTLTNTALEWTQMLPIGDAYFDLRSLDCGLFYFWISIYHFFGVLITQKLYISVFWSSLWLTIKIL